VRDLRYRRDVNGERGPAEGVGDVWHLVEAKRDDGAPTMFRIRELAPRRELTRIFVVELPYPTTELSRLPDAAAYRRVKRFEDEWLAPACAQLGWELVAAKTCDGSFFLYMYGARDPHELIGRLAPFDAGLGFYDDDDPEWQEYAALRELLDRAKAMPAKRERQRPTKPRKRGGKAARANTRSSRSRRASR
jgi:hypothetical protein